MYRMLSPSAEEADADMGIATPRGTGGRSPPPPAAGTRLDRPPGAHLLAQASLGAGVYIVAGDDHRTNENAAALNSGDEVHVSARGRQQEPRPLRASVFSMLTSDTRSTRSRSR
eukprot:4970907-Amphidinium_carterae.1